MDINIFDIYTANNWSDYSASQNEIGAGAGQITWGNAMDHFRADRDARPLLVSTEDELTETREWLLDFGAWDEDEVQAMTTIEINALLLQSIAGDLREREYYVESGELVDYEERLGGRLCIENDVATYYVGN